jgi:Raf kinase inhibitor-like YbhB/YbcL family protein
MPKARSSMVVTSPAFGPGERIPDRHTGYGDDVSPELNWADPPAGTRSFAVLCHDPDAPFVNPGGTYGVAHWVTYNIPDAVRGLPEGVSADRYTTGPHQLGRQEYGGPLPPVADGVHHYVFWLLALDLPPTIEPGLSMWELLAHVEPHVIGMNRLIGTYEKVDD